MHECIDVFDVDFEGEEDAVRMLDAGLRSGVDGRESSAGMISLDGME